MQDIYIKQVFTEGLVALVVTLVIVILFLGFSVWMIKDIRKENNLFWEEIGLVLFVAIISPILIIVPLVLVSNISKVINPEYYVLEKIQGEGMGEKIINGYLRDKND